jgi:hypothetical protein
LLVAAFILAGTCYTLNRIPLIQNFDNRYVYNIFLLFRDAAHIFRVFQQLSRCTLMLKTRIHRVLKNFGSRLPH